MAYSSNGYLLYQHKYNVDILNRDALNNQDISSITLSTPMGLHLKLQQDDGDALSQPV